MAYPKEKRELLRQKYVYEQLPLETAAQAVGIAHVTARSWKYAAKEKGDDWDKMRAAHLMAGNGLEDVGRMILTGLLVQYQNTVEQLNQSADTDPLERVKALSSLADAFNKAVSGSKKILPETNRLAMALEILEKLMTYTQAQQPQHLGAIVAVCEPFAAWIEKELG